MLFENDEDRSNEERIADRVKNWLADKNRIRQFKKMSDTNTVDYAICNGRAVTGFLECKQRTFPSDHYDSILIDLSKMIALLEFASWSTVPVWLAVNYSDDRLFVYRIGNKMRDDIEEVRWLERRDPRWPFDNKPVVLLNRQHFIAVR